MHGTEKLHCRQETPDPPETLATVPSLSLVDIPKEPISVPIDVSYLLDCSYRYAYYFDV